MCFFIKWLFNKFNLLTITINNTVLWEKFLTVDTHFIINLLDRFRLHHQQLDCSKTRRDKVNSRSQASLVATRLTLDSSSLLLTIVEKKINLLINFFWSSIDLNSLLISYRYLIKYFDALFFFACFLKNENLMWY